MRSMSNKNLWFLHVLFISNTIQSQMNTTYEFSSLNTVARSEKINELHYKASDNSFSLYSFALKVWVRKVCKSEIMKPNKAVKVDNSE